MQYILQTTKLDNINLAGSVTHLGEELATLGLHHYQVSRFFTTAPADNRDTVTSKSVKLFEVTNFTNPGGSYQTSKFFSYTRHKAGEVISLT